MVNLVFIHGVSYQTTGYSNWLFKQIIYYYKKFLKQKGVKQGKILEKTAQFIQREILWADVTTDLTNRYIALEYELLGRKGGLWNWVTKRIDPLVLQIMYYIKDKGDKTTGAMGILEKLDKSIKTISTQVKNMMIIAHSLGSVIAFDYIFGFRKYKLPSDCQVLAFITLGSPIPIFTSAMGHVDSDLILPANIKAWYNILDKDDGIARRCKPFFPEIPLKEIEVNTGVLPLSAHTRYWRNKSTASVIAKILTEF